MPVPVEQVLRRNQVLTSVAAATGVGAQRPSPVSLRVATRHDGGMSNQASAFTEEERAKIIAAVVAHRGVSEQDADRLVRSTEERRAKRNPLLEAQWVRVLAAVTRKLVAGDARPVGLFISVFWIRLYGVITDLREAHRAAADLRTALRAKGSDHPLLAASEDVFLAASAIQEELSDEELVYAAFARQVHAHVYQSGFELGIERGNPAKGQTPRLRTGQLVRTLRRHVGVDEAHRIVDAVSAQFGHDDREVAKAFATTVEPHVQLLAAAMESLKSEREGDAARTADELPVGVRDHLD